MTRSTPFVGQPEFLPKLPTIIDPTLHHLVTRPLPTLNLIELRCLDLLADHGRAALKRQAAVLAHELVQRKNVFAMEMALRHLISPTSISLVSFQYSLHYNFLSHTDNHDAIAALFFSRLGAVVFDGSESGVALEERQFTTWSAKGLKDFVRQLFSTSILELYRAELEGDLRTSLGLPIPPRGGKTSRRWSPERVGSRFSDLYVIKEESDDSGTEEDEGLQFAFDVDVIVVDC